MGITLRPGQFYGRKSEATDTEGYSISESTYALSSKLPTHSHELAHFCYVIEGSYTETIGRRTFDRLPSTLVFYPTDASHSETHLTNGCHFLVEIQPTALERAIENGAKLNEPVLFERMPANWLAARMYREFRIPDAFSSLALESISTELLVAASRNFTTESRGKPPRWLAVAREYLNESVYSTPSLTELAAVAGVHSTHLARVFRRFEGCTIGDYMRRSRIERAKARMVNTGDALVQIALDCGFSDQSHLTRTFKIVTGMTPTEYRKIFSSR